jgi:sensor histidine kinase regulating citrate/malate metabolism
MISMVIAVIATISLVSYLISHRMVDSFEGEQFSLMGKITQSQLTGAEGKAISVAEVIAAMPAVKTAFAARNRDELLAITQDAYRALDEKYGISQAQFHLPPALSFLRLHNPKKFGDDLSYRNIVVEVNRTNAIRKGLEITSSGVAIFGTRPMTDEAGKAIGSFEVGL